MSSSERPRMGSAMKQLAIPWWDLIPGDIDTDVVEDYLHELFGLENVRIHSYLNPCQLDLPRRLTQEERDELISLASFRSGNCHEEGALVAVPRRRRPSHSSDDGADGHAVTDLVVPRLYRLKDETDMGWYRADATSPIFVTIDFHSEGRDEIVDGLYGDEIRSGATSKVFAVRGRVVSEKAATECESSTQKFALKRIRIETPQADLPREVEALKTAQSLHHPNIVETLSVFRGPDDAAPSLVLAFPLAAGDLESFFLGDHDHDEAIISRKGTLCSQFLGLASALAHLHWSPANVIHRAITASNVLVYLDEKTGRLVLKLAGFGQSIGKHDELAWQTGTAAQLATVSYDEPDIVWKFVTGRGSEARRLPEKCNLFSNDVWRLGCVFAQLCFFIVGGSRGVKRFREAIAVEGEDNGFDWLGDGRPAGPRFDDGDWVKKQVLESIEGLGRESREVAQIQIVLCAMLGRRIYRPDDDAVTKYLIKHTDWAGCHYDDGTRTTRLYPADTPPRVSRFENWGLGIKKWTENLTNWSSSPSFPLISRPNAGSKEQVRVVWKSGNDDLSTTLSQEEARSYKGSCVAYFPGGQPVLPSSGRSAGKRPESGSHTDQGTSYEREHGLVGVEEVYAKLAAVEAAASPRSSQSTIGEKPV